MQDSINAKSLEIMFTVLILLFQNHLASRIHTFVFLPTGSALTVDPLSIHSLTTVSDSTEVASRLIPGTLTSLQLNINMCTCFVSTEVASRLILGTFTSVQLNINMYAGSDSTKDANRGFQAHSPSFN